MLLLLLYSSSLAFFISSFVFVFVVVVVHHRVSNENPLGTAAVSRAEVPSRASTTNFRGRTFRFGVLYWTVQKWHLPVSELTSCQVSVSFARAVLSRGGHACVCAASPLCKCRRAIHTHTCRTRAPSRRPASLPTLYYVLSGLSLSLSFSRACSRSRRHTSARDSVARSLVVYIAACACDIAKCTHAKRVYGLPPCVARRRRRRRRRPLVAPFR